MKKLFILFLMIFTFTLVGCDSASGESGGFNVFEKKLKTTDEMKIKDVKIEANYVSCYITPSGFEYDELEDDGYKSMSITVSYDVEYEKTYTGWDMFYTGKPKYDISIEDESDMGLHLTGLETKSSKTSKSHTYSADFVDIRDNRIALKLGSINIQNALYFTSIVVTYKCYK